MQREMMIYGLEHLYRAGWGDRLRLTPRYAKRRLFKENGPMERAVLERIIRTTECGLAMLVGNGLLVVDKDGPNVGPFADLKSPMSWDSSRGENSMFRTDIVKGTNKIKFNRLEVDILCNDNSIICIPPSEMDTGMVRRWRNGIRKLVDLPLFPDSLLKEEPRPHPKVTEMPTSAKIEGARRWVRRIGNGDGSCFRAAIKLASVIKDVEQLVQELLAWNADGVMAGTIDPPWTEKELRHKAVSALRYFTK